MEQVLFWIPLKTSWSPEGIPVFGFGAMLFLAFFIGSWVAGRIGKRVGVPSDKFADLLIWAFVGGLIGGRVLHVIAENGQWSDFFKIWQGGLVFYGGAIGGAIAATIAYMFLMRPLGVSPWQVADVIAPALALGICFGRLGCYLNGCCYGYVAVPGTPAAHFPALTAPAMPDLVVQRPWQSLAGFAMKTRDSDDCEIGYVEADSPAARADLKPGDVIVAVNGFDTPSFKSLESLFRSDWPRGEEQMRLKVKRGNDVKDLPAFTPRLIGLYPTQVYESISTFLLFVALLATYPRRRYDGQLIALLAIGYAIHRYIVEMLRDDTPKLQLGLTLSQWISVGIFATGVVIILYRRRYPLAGPVAAPATATK